MNHSREPAINMRIVIRRGAIDNRQKTGLKRITARNNGVFRIGADLNGAINMGRHLIMLILSLRDEKGLGMWLPPEKKDTPKAQRSECSKGKSSLPQRLPASREGESVADCHDQTSLLESISSEDPAMVNTTEMPSASKMSGNPGVMQWKEARS